MTTIIKTHCGTKEGSSMIIDLDAESFCLPSGSYFDEIISDYAEEWQFEQENVSQSDTLFDIFNSDIVFEIKQGHYSP